MKIVNVDSTAFYYAQSPYNRNSVLILDTGVYGCLKVLANADKYFRSYYPEFFYVLGKKVKKVTDKEMKTMFIKSLDDWAWSQQEKINLGKYFKIDVSDYLLSAPAKKRKQTGKSNKALDKKRKALPVGKRTSKTGNVYTETRANRSDQDRRKRL
jgi:hypothetical protein